MSVQPGEAELTFLNATPAVDTPSTEQPSETMPPLTQCPVLELCSELKKADIKPPYIIQTLGYGTQPHPPMESCNVAAQGENAKALFIKFLNLTLSGDDDLRINNDGGSRSFNTNSNKLETIKLTGTSFSIIFNPAGKRDRQFTGFQMLVYPDHIQQTQLKYCLNRALSRLPNINNNLPKPEMKNLCPVLSDEEPSLSLSIVLKDLPCT
ncbi:Hypp7794 [Branchiostoma lanceolatum]|uniref:Hypp7794 protein n=1 Tax=Branchiostoma lanceolatum TaxID=7740 RepID=A0A8J9Z3C3_BRALA|nr:Hypp7794 [Branchiostoma lanceolatum]